MPKKFVGENSKAVAARQRKENIKQEHDQKLKQKIDDAAWEENDGKILKKQQKKDDQERRRQQQLEKKAEAKALLEKEMASLKVTTKAPPQKVTRAQITQIKETAAKKEQEKPPSRVIEEPILLQENLNRVQIDGEVAQSVEEAITVLKDSKCEIDRHPEKRMKAALAAFEEVRMPQLKAENPTLRLSQLKQLLRKEWLKSPQNPVNQKL